MGRAAIADLVIVNDGTPAGRQVLERIDIVMRAARPAMQDEERRLARFEVPGDAMPALVVSIGSQAFDDGHCDSPGDRVFDGIMLAPRATHSRTMRGK